MIVTVLYYLSGGQAPEVNWKLIFFVSSFIYSVQQRLWTLPGLKYMRMSTESKDLSVGSKMPKMCRWVNCPVIEIDHQFCNKHFFACLWHASWFVL